MQDNRIMTNEEMKSAHSFIMRENPTPKLKKHISVCICTYKRPKWLDHLLKKLQEQETSELFTYSIILIDNIISNLPRKLLKIIKNLWLPSIINVNLKKISHVHGIELSRMRLETLLHLLMTMNFLLMTGFL